MWWAAPRIRDPAGVFAPLTQVRGKGKAALKALVRKKKMMKWELSALFFCRKCYGNGDQYTDGIWLVVTIGQAPSDRRRTPRCSDGSDDRNCMMLRRGHRIARTGKERGKTEDDKRWHTREFYINNRNKYKEGKHCTLCQYHICLIHQPLHPPFGDAAKGSSPVSTSG